MILNRSEYSTGRTPLSRTALSLQTKRPFIPHCSTPAHPSGRILISRPDLRVRPPLGFPVVHLDLYTCSGICTRPRLSPALVVANLTLASPLRVVRTRARIYLSKASRSSQKSLRVLIFDSHRLRRRLDPVLPAPQRAEHRLLDRRRFFHEGCCSLSRHSCHC
jgi:hypothetical protein